MPDYGLGRLPEFDARSRQYPVTALLTTTRPRSYTWSCKAWLDQGTEGACVGYAWAHEHAARPYERDATGALARTIYKEAQKIDEWPGERYDGTSVLAGAKIMQRMGLLAEYRWAFNLNDALTAISRHGPAVIGIKWYDWMYTPDDKGFIYPEGEIVGGHAILVRGVNVRRKTVTLRNSWGQGWGRGGDCFMHWDDLGRLLDDDGEVCVPVLRGPGK